MNQIPKTQLLIFHKEISLAEGFEVLHQSKDNRLVAGKQVAGASGWPLFKSLEGTPIRCWCCGCQADRWVVDKGANDHVGLPVLNLYGLANKKLVLINRDHIIPRSLGGIDDNENLRAACEVCNSERGNQVNSDDLTFRALHPHLISAERVKRGLKNALAQAALCSNKEDRQKVLAPFIAIGEL